jgi:hypothetical protein
MKYLSKKMILVSFCFIVFVTTSISLAMNHQSQKNDSKKTLPEVIIKDTDFNLNKDQIAMIKKSNDEKIEKAIEKSKNPITAVSGVTSKRIEVRSFENANFPLNDQDLSQYLEDGYAVEDIFKFYELGNRYAKDPKEIIKQFKEKKKSVSYIERSLEDHRVQKYRRILRTQFSKEYDLISQNGLSRKDELTLLRFLIKNDVTLTQEILDEFKENKNILKEKYKKEKEKHKKVKEKHKKEGIAHEAR